MTIDLQNKSFTLSNNFGNTFVAIFELSKVNSFKDESQFKEFLNKYKNEIKEAQESKLFEADSTYALGGFDVQVATAGIKDNLIAVTLGGSCSSTLIEDVDPVKGFGTILTRMLNMYFDKEYILSGDPKPGQIPYTIKAIQLNETIIVDTFDEDFEKYNELQPKKVEGQSPLFGYGSYYDYSWDYYFIDAVGDLVELTFDVGRILLESSSNVSPALDFAEPAINIIPDILPSDSAPLDIPIDSTGTVDEGMFDFIGEFFGSMFENCSAPDIDCDCPADGIDCNL
jgi:hypothetical protein